MSIVSMLGYRIILENGIGCMIVANYLKDVGCIHVKTNFQNQKRKKLLIITKYCKRIEFFIKFQINEYMGVGVTFLNSQYYVTYVRSVHVVHFYVTPV